MGAGQVEKQACWRMTDFAQMRISFIFLRFIFYLFILFIFGCIRSFSCGTRNLRWGMWDLSLWRTGSSLQCTDSLSRCTGFSLVAACGFFLFSSCGAQAPGRVGSVVCSTQALYSRHVSSAVVASGLSCPTACGILLPGPGIEPVPPALQGEFFTTWTTREVPRWGFKSWVLKILPSLGTH